MPSLVDAYSIHVYWDYRGPEKIDERLKEVREIVDGLGDAKKPLYVTESGVRGVFADHEAKPGHLVQGNVPVGQTNLNAFQRAWFALQAVRKGFRGVVAWDGYFAMYDSTLQRYSLIGPPEDWTRLPAFRALRLLTLAYFGKYDNGTQDYSLIGPPQQGWPLRPVYYLTRLFTGATRPGWKVVDAEGAPAGKLVSAYAGPNGQLTVIGLDSDGASLSSASPTKVSYRIEGLPPDTPFQLELWNGDGSGRLATVGAVRSDGLGEAAVTAPLQSVFALTTAR